MSKDKIHQENLAENYKHALLNNDFSEALRMLRAGAQIDIHSFCEEHIWSESQRLSLSAFQFFN